LLCRKGVSRGTRGRGRGRTSGNSGVTVVTREVVS
jgi:hypothetical protein